MLRVVLVLILVGGGVVGGFYLGIEYRDRQIKDAPQAFLRKYAKELGLSAKQKLEKVKDVLLEE